jgi:hypothetical protein
MRDLFNGRESGNGIRTRSPGTQPPPTPAVVQSPAFSELLPTGWKLLSGSPRRPSPKISGGGWRDVIERTKAGKVLSRTRDSRFRADRRQPTADSKQPTADSRQPTADSRRKNGKKAEGEKSEGALMQLGLAFQLRRESFAWDRSCAGDNSAVSEDLTAN